VQSRRADGPSERMPRVVARAASVKAPAAMLARAAFAHRASAPRGLPAVAREDRRRAKAGPAASAIKLAVVRDAIITCNRCPRLREYCELVGREKRRAFRDDTYWARPVPGFGDPRARLLLVGLAPAAHGANRTGRVFTGDGTGGSGDFLMAALHRAGFANIPTSRHPDDGLMLRDAFIAAAVRCAPPDNKPAPEEIASCLPHLDAEVSALPRVRIVVALGKIAFDAYLQLLRSRDVAIRPRPQFAHGSVDVLPNGQTLIGCYHPSRQNTNTGKLTARMMDAVFRRAQGLLKNPR
jgi:uracil-DNA glycosylase